MRTLEVSRSSADEIKNFEYKCIGEVRVLGVLNSSCIVKYYGHQISSRWAPSSDGSSECRTLQSAIFMEHIKGGSLKVYVLLKFFSHLTLFILLILLSRL